MTNSKTESVHGNAVVVFGVGLILLGPSGIGKTECALELTRRGHGFIADDRVVVSQQDGKLFAAAKSGWEGKAHIRDLGVIEIGQIYGSKAMLSPTPLCAAIELHRDHEPEPVAEPQKYVWETQGLSLPLFRIHNASGRANLIVEIIAKQLLEKSHGQSQGRSFTLRNTTP